MNVYALVLALIVLALLSVSVSQVRKTQTKADYLVAGRTLPWYILVFTLLSSWIGSGSLFAGAENAFHNGFAALWQGAGGWCGLLVIYFIAPARPEVRPVHHPRPAGDPLRRLGPGARGGGDPLRLHRHRLRTSSRVAETSCASSSPASTSRRARPSGWRRARSTRWGMVIIAVFVVVFTALAGMASVAYMDVVIGGLTDRRSHPLGSLPPGAGRGLERVPRRAPARVLPGVRTVRRRRRRLRPGDGAPGPDDAAPARQPEHLPEVLQRPGRAGRAALGHRLARGHGGPRDPHRGHRRPRRGALPPHARSEGAGDHPLHRTQRRALAGRSDPGRRSSPRSSPPRTTTCSLRRPIWSTTCTPAS